MGEGDSLTRISLRYYGTPNRWQEIYDANRDVLQGENALRLGQRLKILVRPSWCAPTTLHSTSS